MPAPVNAINECPRLACRIFGEIESMAGTARTGFEIVRLILIQLNSGKFLGFAAWPVVGNRHGLV